MKNRGKDMKTDNANAPSSQSICRLFSAKSPLLMTQPFGNALVVQALEQ
jgi:hypothetical protein